MMPRVIMLTINYAKFCIEGLHCKCHYSECCYAECHYAECHCAECHYAECHYADCLNTENHYGRCHYVEVSLCWLPSYWKSLWWMALCCVSFYWLSRRHLTEQANRDVSIIFVLSSIMVSITSWHPIYSPRHGRPINFKSHLL